MLLAAISSLFVNPSRCYDRHSPYYRFLLQANTALAMGLLGFRVRTEGLEQLPEGRFLLVSNHCSRLDPILTWHALRKRQLAFLSKPENFSIPIFGRIIRRCCFLPIHRHDPRQAMTTICRAAQLLEQDTVSIGVYPEGTRNKGPGLLPFHDGVFKIAQRAGVPLVVVYLHGTQGMRWRPFRRQTALLRVVDVLPAHRVRAMTTHQLGELVRIQLLHQQALYTERTD